MILIFILPLLLVKLNYKVGLFAIAFCISYWTIKVFESYYYVLKSYVQLLSFNKKDLRDSEIFQAEAKKVHHVVIVPIYTEPFDVIEENILSILDNDYPYMERVTVLLATEARATDSQKHAAAIISRFQDAPIEIVNVMHPADLPGE